MYSMLIHILGIARKEERLWKHYFIAFILSYAVRICLIRYLQYSLIL